VAFGATACAIMPVLKSGRCELKNWNLCYWQLSPVPLLLIPINRDATLAALACSVAVHFNPSFTYK
jgi:hypothetical protein